MVSSIVFSTIDEDFGHLLEMTWKTGWLYNAMNNSKLAIKFLSAPNRCHVVEHKFELMTHFSNRCQKSKFDATKVKFYASFDASVCARV